MNKNSIAYCGLICDYCYPNGGCSCKSNNHCGKRLSPEGCYQYRCCTSKGIDGCWECGEVPCGIDMLAPDKIKMRAFVRCIYEDGIEKFIEYITRNQENRIVYHRSGVIGDYDLAAEDEVLELLRNGAVNFKERNHRKMEKTIEYYNKNAKNFVDRTRDLTLSDVQDKFLNYLTPGARVLDFGCGSGRDTKYFLNHGFQVDAMDGSEEFVKIASDYTKIEVKQMLFQELDAEGVYDGIWACASILHLTQSELADVLGKMEKALVSKGIIYTSFKYGTAETERNGRFFTDMTKERMADLLEKVDLFAVEEQWITSDARPGREEEKWLNVILRTKR